MVSFSCHCEERKKPVEKRNWFVLLRNHNHSYFAYLSGHAHYSEYSTVKCAVCGMCGRTKANYVKKLKDYNWKGGEHEYS